MWVLYNWLCGEHICVCVSSSPMVWNIMYAIHGKDLCGPFTTGSVENIAICACPSGLDSTVCSPWEEICVGAGPACGGNGLRVKGPDLSGH